MIPNADSKAWYLLANPRDMATIESSEMDFSVLGVQMRGFFDYGITKQDPCAGVKMAGR